jgi:hypothetical protein
MGKYFSLSGAWDDVIFSYGAKDKAISIAKLVGKTASNTVVFGVTEVVPGILTEAVPAMMKSTANKADQELKRNDLSSEQREKLEHISKTAKDNLEKYTNK